MTDEKQKEFLEVFEPARESLSRFAMAMARDRDDALDLASETILVAYENFEKIRNKDAFVGYLFTTACRIFKRKKWRARIFADYDERKAENLISPETPPDAGPDVEALYRALDRLPQKQKEAVAMFELSGLSLKEIRDIQGGSLSGVKSRIARGREKLAEILGVKSDVVEKKKINNNGLEPVSAIVAAPIKKTAGKAIAAE